MLHVNIVVSIFALFKSIGVKTPLSKLFILRYELIVFDR